MSDVISCVLLADRHHGLADGIRGLLATVFRSVVMVADETSLFDTAERLHPTLVIIDLSLPRSQNLEWMGRLRGHCPGAKLILLSVHDEPGVCRLALAAGADGFLLKRSLGSELLPAVDAVLQGNRYVALALAGKVPFSPAPAAAHLEKDQAP